METVAICSPDIRRIYPRSIIQNFSFCNRDIPIGILPFESYNCDFKTDNDVLIEVKSFSCNYRDRALLISFYHKCRFLNKEGKIIFSPFGSDFIAIVKKTASNVKSLQVGDRVIPNCHYYDSSGIGMGIPTNFASQRKHVFHEEMLIKIPDSMSNEVAASFSINSQTAFSILRKASIKQGENILITAPTSNTSLSVINALKNFDCKIFVTSYNQKNDKFLLDLDIDQFIPAKELLEDGNNKFFFDVVIDPFYDLYLNGVIKHINYNGRYIFCGFCEQYMTMDKSEFLFKEDFKDIFTICVSRNISIIGNCLGLRSDLEDAIKNYSDKKYNVLIDSVFTGVDVIPFLDRSFKESTRVGKVVYSYIN